MEDNGVAKSSRVDRREFLSKLTATVGGTATLALASSMVQATPYVEKTEETISVPKAKGYQRTQHVDTYYQLADF
ncbi:MAG: Tat pathway signal protein [Piscirickettsiaceae bacterium]|nr:Tat pathway signal protein [Piscirickettsiaceae bacterium]